MQYSAGDPLKQPVPWASIPAAFWDTANERGAAPALYFRRHGVWQSISWQEYATLVEALAAYWIDRGVRPGDRVALLSPNCYEWLITDLSLLSAGAITVPIHTALSPEQVAFQLTHSGTRFVVLGRGMSDTFLSAVERTAGGIKEWQTVCFAQEELEALRRRGIAADRLEAAVSRGLRRAHAVAAERRKREAGIEGSTPATILYTSGTTGEPKGVILTHGNLLSNAWACLQWLEQPECPLQLNWLPYSHVFARLSDHYLPALAGTPVALSEGIDSLVRDLSSAEPTHMSTVPRFLEKLHTKLSELPAERRSAVVRSIVGERFAWAISGGAALGQSLAEDFAKWGLLVLQGYGLTESSPVISVNAPQHNRFGSVGRPIPGVEVAIAPDGEVLTRGPHVMAGYWENPTATAEAIRDGWLHTGDLGRIDGDGFLWITGRKKELIVLSTGKNVAPVPIESALLQSPLIDQVMVVGDGRPYLAALIVPSHEQIAARLGGGTERGHVEQGRLVDEPRVRELIGAVVEEVNDQLARWEQIKRFALIGERFTVEGGELTPTLKLRRAVIERKYADVIEGLYS